MNFLKKLLKEFKAITGNEGGWAWAIPVGMAAMGYMQGKEEEERAKQMNKAAAVQTQFSPWTKMGQGKMVSPRNTALGGAVQGGLTGASFMQGFNSANATASGSPQMTSQGQEMMVNQAKATSPVIAGDPVNATQGTQGTWSNMFNQKPNYRTSTGLYS